MCAFELGLCGTILLSVTLCKLYQIWLVLHKYLKNSKFHSPMIVWTSWLNECSSISCRSFFVTLISAHVGNGSKDKGYLLPIYLYYLILSFFSFSLNAFSFEKSAVFGDAFLIAFYMETEMWMCLLSWSTMSVPAHNVNFKYLLLLIYCPSSDNYFNYSYDYGWFECTTSSGW